MAVELLCLWGYFSKGYLRGLGVFKGLWEATGLKYLTILNIFFNTTTLCMTHSYTTNWIWRNCSSITTFASQYFVSKFHQITPNQISLSESNISSKSICYRGIATTFLEEWAPYLKDQKEKENEENLRKNKRKYRNIRKKWGNILNLAQLGVRGWLRPWSAVSETWNTFTIYEQYLK